jgi:osmotically-inducible protein OsmY
MRNRNHNRRGVLNTSNPDWNEDRGNYGRGYQNHGYDNDRGNFNYGNSNEGQLGYGTSIGRRYENYGSDRNYNDRGGYSENQFSRDSGFNRGRGGRDEGHQNYNDWRSTSGSGNDYGRDYLNYGSERGANDRSWDEYDRSNYEGRNYNRGSNFGGGSYGSDYNRNRRGQDSDDRGWWDKTSDEVSSWFGDEDAERRREMDRQRSGQHRGKGPKGYSRSDERIKEDVNDRLSDDVFVDASEIEVTVNQGEVTLTGTVNEKSEKRRAEDIAERVSGVRNVENRIKVTSSSQWTGTSEWSGGTSRVMGSNPSQSTSVERSTNSDRSRQKETV